MCHLIRGRKRERDSDFPSHFTQYSVPLTWYNVQGTMYRVQDTYPIPCTLYLAPHTPHLAPCTLYVPVRTLYPVPFTLYHVPCTWYISSDQRSWTDTQISVHSPLDNLYLVNLSTCSLKIIRLSLSPGLGSFIG